MKINYDQQAREMAERCAEKLTNKYGDAMCQTRNDEINTILRELNLASLLEDKARLDWLCDTAVEIKLAGHPPKSIPCSTIPIRTAITQAMKEDRK